MKASIQRLSLRSRTRLIKHKRRVIMPMGNQVDSIQDTLQANNPRIAPLNESQLARATLAPNSRIKSWKMSQLLLGEPDCKTKFTKKL